MQIEVGIGIASGQVVAGYTGTLHRATYTCVGEHAPCRIGDDLPRCSVPSGTEQQRGDAENRIKEMKAGVSSDRLSCMFFASNKVRLAFHALAYVLLQRLRRLARGTGLARAQVDRLRLSLLKIAARVKESTRRVQVELCSSCPTQPLFRLLARRLGVAPG